MKKNIENLCWGVKAFESEIKKTSLPFLEDSFGLVFAPPAGLEPATL